MQRIKGEHANVPLDQYAQLYVPFDWFKAACKQVKSYYKDSNGYAGYHNYMKYWARNGEWIDETQKKAGNRLFYLN